MELQFFLFVPALDLRVLHSLLYEAPGVEAHTSAETCRTLCAVSSTYIYLQPPRIHGKGSVLIEKKQPCSVIIK
jgi:hypothetical protein